MNQNKFYLKKNFEYLVDIDFNIFVKQMNNVVKQVSPF